MKVGLYKSTIQLLIVVLISVSCRSNLSKYYNYDNAISGLYSASQLSMLKGIIIIPGEGCGNCISEAGNFCLKHKDSLRQYGVIFTGVKDRKLLRLQFGPFFSSNKNALVDHKDIFMNDSLKSVYPQLIMLENAKIVTVDNFDPQKLTVN